MGSPIKSPRLRRIIAAYTVNRLGTWFGTIALSLAVFDHTHSAIAVAAVLVAGQVVPAFVVPSLIARIEASRRRSELSALYFFEAAATTAIAVLLWNFWLPGILLLAALDGTAALAANALLRTEGAKVANEEAPAGAEPHAAEQQLNAALNVAFSAVFVLGPLLAGLTVAAAGAPTALFIDAGSFVICGALLLDLHPFVEDAAGETVLARLTAAWEHVKSEPSLKALLLAQGIGLVFFESAVPIEIAYVKRTLLAGDRGYGLLVAGWGVGVVLGSIVFARAGQRRLAAMLTLGTFAIGCGYLGFAIAPSLGIATAAAVLGGIGNGMQYAAVIGSVQRLTPPALQGRVMGFLESISAISPAIGLTLGGVLVAVTSPRAACFVIGTGAVLTTFAFARVRMDDPDADPRERADRVTDATIEKQEARLAIQASPGVAAPD